MSYGAVFDVTGRDRTCGASRFRRALYPLSYGHEGAPRRRRSGNRTGGLLRIREALCRLSYPPLMSKAGSRTVSLLFVDRHSPIELPARM